MAGWAVQGVLAWAFATSYFQEQIIHNCDNSGIK